MERNILDRCTSSIICLDLQLNINYFNKSTKTFFKDVNLGDNIIKLFEFEFDRLKSYLDIATQNPFTYVFKIKGSYYKTLISILNDQYMLEINDIENEFFFNIINNIESGVVLCDPLNYNLIYGNENFYKVTGYEKEEIIGKNLSLLKVDNTDEIQREKLKEKLESKENFTVVLKNQNKNGSIYYNKVSVSPIKNKYTNRIQFYLGTQNDVTDETIENKYFKAVLNNSKSIMIVNSNGQIKNINKRFFEIFDYIDLKDFTDKHNCICELFVKKDTNYVTADMNGIPWHEYIKENHDDNLRKVCMIDKNGEERIFQIDSSGKLFEYADDELITLSEITALIKSNQMLKDQSKHAMMGEMIAMIAHQWRQPLATLNTILAKINILNDMGMLDDNEFKKAYSKSTEIIQHLSNTIDDFRNFFHKNEKLEEIELNNLIKKSFNLLESNFKIKEISFDVKYINHIENLVIKVNSSKMTQVLINLIKNAYDELIKHDIENKKVTVICDKTKDKVFISVMDNAGGIPEEIKDKIFDPYFSTKSKNGTGLGLYMSKMIVEDQMKGTLTVKNLSKGAMFNIVIPINVDGELENE